MRLFNKVAIIGVGLIGGSIGLAIKKRKLAGQVIGISRHRTTINRAIKRGAIDRGSLGLGAAEDADLVILAAPVKAIINRGRRIRFLVRPDALVTDVGSTKRLVVKSLENILPNFIGAHPLAGSEKQGAANAEADLFCGSLCVLTPTAKTSKQALSRLKRFWTKLGARVVCLSPAKHDRLISSVSHLPHIVAFSVIHSLARNSLYLASSGLKDSTRIAASPVEIWKDILLTNSDNALKTLDRFLSSLSRLRRALRRNDAKALERILRQARLKREQLKP